MDYLPTQGALEVHSPLGEPELAVEEGAGAEDEGATTGADEEGATTEEGAGATYVELGATELGDGGGAWLEGAAEDTTEGTTEVARVVAATLPLGFQVYCPLSKVIELDFQVYCPSSEEPAGAEEAATTAETGDTTEVGAGP